MSIDIRPLGERDLPEADRIFRLAFGTFLGLPDPMKFAAGQDLIGTRWRAPACNEALGAFNGETLVGSNFMAHWGSFGFFGPLTVRPDYWSQGVAQKLLQPTMDTFARWGVTQAALFTFPQSPKHLALYQKYDFWAQHLTPLMAKPVVAAEKVPDAFTPSHSDLTEGARALTDSIYQGLDLTAEIHALLEQNLGEVVAVGQGPALSAFAVCHMGEGSEAGPNTAYVKFAAARNATQFDRLLAACEALAHRRGLGIVAAGVNMACQSAYRRMLQTGYRTQFTGVAMQRGNSTGYLTRDAFVLSDWR